MNIVQVQHLSDLEFYLKIRGHALEIMQITYGQWEAWKDSKDPRVRSLSLVAKTHGLIAYDTLMAAAGE